MTRGHTPVEPIVRLWKKVTVDPRTGCWIFNGARSDGYGKLRGSASAGSRWVLPHRLTYEYWLGPIPDGLQLDHLCRNRACCNPRHLEPVTGRENQLRGFSVSAVNARKTHCPEGHPYSDVRRSGRRYCRICRNEKTRIAKRRRRQRQKSDA